MKNFKSIILSLGLVGLNCNYYTQEFEPIKERSTEMQISFTNNEKSDSELLFTKHDYLTEKSNKIIENNYFNNEFNTDLNKSYSELEKTIGYGTNLIPRFNINELDQIFTFSNTTDYFAKRYLEKIRNSDLVNLEGTKYNGLITYSGLMFYMLTDLLVNDTNLGIISVD